ncbi:MAG TPA: hypothetical protein VGD56_15045, partial [Gemmatirosa sp.]
RELFVTRATPGIGPAIYRTTRTGAGAAFGPPHRLAVLDGFVEAPALSPDGALLYYHQRSPSGFVICRLRRVGPTAGSATAGSATAGSATAGSATASRGAHPLRRD